MAPEELMDPAELAGLTKEILEPSQTRPNASGKSVLMGPIQLSVMRSPTSILCSYRNCTNRIVIVRARGLGTYYLERVVFPFELMTFHCPRDCEVEVIMRTPGGLEESEWVAAEELMAGEQMVEPGSRSEQLLAHTC